MASRNVLKIDLENTYYHIYARGNNRQAIFLENKDYTYFTYLLRRYLSNKEFKNSMGVPYEKLGDRIEILCYCLMTNHFHLLAYQLELGSMQRLMRGVMTAYSRYFNARYKRSGSLFESRYKAINITNQSYLEHISRYIHLNPKQWQTYPHSSLAIYLQQQHSDWLRPNRISVLFASPQEYNRFIADYEMEKSIQNAIKHELANEGY